MEEIPRSELLQLEDYQPGSQGSTTCDHPRAFQQRAAPGQPRGAGSLVWAILLTPGVSSWGRGLCVGEQLPGVQTLPAQPSFWCFQNELRSPPLPFSPPVALVLEHQSCCCFRARRRLPRRLELISFFSSFSAGTEQPGTEAPHSWRENQTAPAVNEMRKIMYAWLCSQSSDVFP